MFRINGGFKALIIICGKKAPIRCRDLHIISLWLKFIYTANSLLSPQISPTIKATAACGGGGRLETLLKSEREPRELKISDRSEENPLLKTQGAIVQGELSCVFLRNLFY